ncbi:acetyl/propionyl/methylcrotonyl-CoA carboxylase subunit alpha [Brucella sp. IR073]|uniref:acetyl/propionyl/methylcrotonyl-CoA carboxylase subunit alpha n=1 Tax=unclassified Brucella TaxID=2632610 RepID=UPI003B985100
MIESLLIANRGEIARRIIRTARRLKLRTVAVYSEADSGMPFVREADEGVCIGPAAARESYLRQDRILDAAKQTGAEAIHPGYGFLSENAEFAEVVIGAGLVWIGAPPAAIRAMGLKDAAKALMGAAGVPVTPGYLGEDQSEARLQKEADIIGYPVLIKAVAGGGGKGMRRVDRKEDFRGALASCRREAAAAFGNDRMLIEKYVLSPRHIEVQIFGDSFGNVVYLFERDCSLQRRHQKVVEEAPAPGMDAAIREAICRAAVKAARAVDYVGAGTIEFIADASQGLRADRVWFMEMNTRLQVEHPVTEAITGQDLVEWQIRVASGEPLPLKQDELSINGSAMEARLYAENPANGFLPSTGPLEHFSLPGGLRIDSGVEQGDEITPHYDPMIAKIVSHAPSRDEAATKLADGMAEVQIAPVKTNAAFLTRTLRHPAFLAGEVDTGFIERHLPDLISPDEPATPIAPKANNPWQALTGFRINAEPARTAAALRRADSAVAGTADGAILAPMPGIVISVPVVQGDKVKRGQPLAVIEAMKMEQVLSAPFDGVVAEITVSEGMQIAEGSLLIRVEGTR